MTTPPCKLGGRYRLWVRREPSGRLVADTGWFDNVFTLLGLDGCGTGGSTAIYVGSGTSSPSVNDTALNSVLAGQGLSYASGQDVAQYTTLPYYWGTKYGATFSTGAIVGTIREVGVGPGSTSLWSRSLLKDQNGNPTELTLGVKDRLYISYEFRQYLTDISDTSFDLNVNGTIVSCVCRPCYINDPSAWAPRLGCGVAVSNNIAFYYTATPPYISTDLTGGPLGDQVSPENQNHSTDAYVPGSYKRRLRSTIPTTASRCIVSAARITGRAYGGYCVSVGGGWQFSFTPPIVKEYNQSAAFVFDTHWSFYP